MNDATPDTALDSSRPVPPRARDSISLAVHAVMANLVALPLLRKGHLLLLDFSYGPNVAVRWKASSLAQGPPNMAPIESVFWLLRLTGPAAAYLLIFLLCFGAGYAMNKAVGQLLPGVRAPARIVTGTLYAINPFTYARLVHGQIGVLAGMVLLPLVAVAFVRLVRSPSAGNAAILGLAVAVLGFASLHVAGMLVLILPVLAAISGRPQIRLLAFAAVVTLFLSSWWIAQLASVPPPAFSGQDLQAFATTPQGVTSAGNVATLYGFWRVGEFQLPRDGVWAWPLTFAPIAALVIWGLIGWRKIKRAAALALGVLAVISILLACGISFPPSRGAFRWLFENVPGFGLYREPQKWVVALLFAYALLATPAVGRLIDWAGSRSRQNRTSGRVVPEVSLVTLALLAIVLFYGRTMILNTAALKPVSFPKDWTTVDQLTKAEPSRLLIFPWHLYMTFPFTGHRIANPAETFFNSPVVASDSIEVGSIRTQVDNPESKLVEGMLFDEGGHDRLQEVLNGLCARWVVVFKAADWASYQWLDAQSLLTRAFDGPTIRLYKAASLSCT